MMRKWYVDRYIERQLLGEPQFRHRIIERETERVIARDMVKIEAEHVVALHNEVLSVRSKAS